MLVVYFRYRQQMVLICHCSSVLLGCGFAGDVWPVSVEVFSAGGVVGELSVEGSVWGADVCGVVNVGGNVSLDLIAQVNPIASSRNVTKQNTVNQVSTSPVLAPKAA